MRITQVSESRVALVTGAGSGIGRSCALALLESGWRVVLAGRRLPQLQQVVEDAKAPHRASAVVCDVTQDASVANLFEEIRNRIGRLDLLFNNAGVVQPEALPDELLASTWRRVVDTNLNGTYYCLAAAFRLMREQKPRGGRIINNGSIAAHVPRPKSIAYTATKHAITGLTRAAALDGRVHDIAVGQIDIGNVVSDMTSKIAVGALQADGSLREESRMDMTSVTSAFMAMANLPLTANVLFMTVMATKMPLVGRG